MSKIHRVTLYPGEGIGPEVTDAAVRVIAATGVQIDWDRQVVGFEAAKLNGRDPLPKEALDSFRENRVALKGPLGTPSGGDMRSLNVALRKIFDLYQCVRPVKTLRGVWQPISKPVDFVLFRENTEDFYAGVETIDPNGEYGECTGRITRRGSERIARAAFEYARAHRTNSPYARAHGRPKVTLLHKANIIKMYAILIDATRKIAQEYPDVEYDDDGIMVDARGAHSIRNPEWFDVLIAPNLFGDLFSDWLAGMGPGIGFAQGANIGKDHALFESVHGTWPKAAGKNIANPCATILSAVMMLRHLGEVEAANKIEGATMLVLEEGKNVTTDVNPNGVGTREMADAIIRNIESK